MHSLCIERSLTVPSLAVGDVVVTEMLLSQSDFDILLNLRLLYKLEI